MGVPSTQSSQEAGKDTAIDAKNFLINLLAGEKVWMVYGDSNHRDTSERRLADVYRAPAKLWVNLELV